MKEPDIDYKDSQPFELGYPLREICVIPSDPELNHLRRSESSLPRALSPRLPAVAPLIAGIKVARFPAAPGGKAISGRPPFAAREALRRLPEEPALDASPEWQRIDKEWRDSPCLDLAG